MTNSKLSKANDSSVINNESNVESKVTADDMDSILTRHGTTESVQYPNAEWQKFGPHHWAPSDLSKNLHQAMINIGDGIELCVEAGGDPKNPPLLMIMGLGSQMVFWPNSFIKRFIDAGFFVIRFDLGFKTYNPANETNRRWLREYNFANSVLNFGINYPF